MTPVEFGVILAIQGAILVVATFNGIVGKSTVNLLISELARRDQARNDAQKATFEEQISDEAERSVSERNRTEKARIAMGLAENTRFDLRARMFERGTESDPPDSPGKQLGIPHHPV